LVIPAIFLYPLYSSKRLFKSLRKSSLEYKVTTSGNWETTVEVAVSADDIKARYDQAVHNIQKKATLEGFRKGKVPPAMVKKLFAAQIQVEAVDIGMEDAWRKVFEENDFDVFNDPAIHERRIAENGDLTFKIIFEQRPHFEVSGYEGMDVDKVIWDVTSEDVDAVLEDLRQRQAMLYSTEEAARMGDFVVGEFQEVDSGGVPILGQRFDNQQIGLTEKDNELTPQLIGVKPGDQRQVVLKVRSQKSEFVDQPYKTDEVQKIYKVTVKEVKERRLPELDDDFVKDLGNRYETLQELREVLEKDLKDRAEHETQFGFEESLASELVKRIDLELPPSMIEHYLDNLVEDLQKRNRDNPNSFDEEQYRTVYRPRAIFDLKWHLISEQLKKQQQFVVTDEEVEAKLSHYHEHEDGDKQIQKFRENKREMAKFKDSIVFDKLYAFLADQANVHETNKPYRELLAAANAPQDEEVLAD
jgi:trigger factor